MHDLALYDNYTYAMLLVPVQNSSHGRFGIPSGFHLQDILPAERANMLDALLEQLLTSICMDSDFACGTFRQIHSSTCILITTTLHQYLE